jgi:outer membrane receptor protein involved in Fe transport
MVKKFFTIWVLVLTSFLSFAQTDRQSQNVNFIPIGKLSGEIFDKITSKPIEYSNVVIYNSKDSSLINGTITNPSGEFSFDKLPFGRMYVKISYIGYKTIIIDSIIINPKSKEINLGRIILETSAFNLDEVVVASERDMMVNNLDKKIINVEKNITSAGGTAVDVMQNIPSVSVDVDGAVSLRGNKNVTILIDGRPNGLASIGSGDLLNQIPASSIESIELVTNPSAKYDPEGTAGIINIVLKKRTNIGLNGIISANAGTGDKYNSSLNFNLRQYPFNFFASYDGRVGNMTGTGTTDRLTTIGGVSSSLFQNQNDKNLMLTHNANTGFDFLINDYNTLTLSMQYRRFAMENDVTVNNLTYNSSDIVTRNFTRLSGGDRAVDFRNYTLSYKKTYDSKGEEFTTDFMFNDIDMNFNQEITQNEFETGGAVSQIQQRTFSKNENQMFILQSNYKHPFEGFGTLETGFKSTFRKLLMKSDYENFDAVSSIWLNDPLSRNYFKNDEQIHAVYATFAGVFAGVKYQTGLRAEQTTINGKQEVNNFSYTKDYLSFYPSLHLVKEFADQNEVQLSYSRRVNRPHPRSINPVVDYTDSLNITQGNPYLDPEFVNSYELGYSKYWGASSFSSNLFYKLTNGLIGNYSELEPSGITRTTFLNLSKGTSYGVELTGNHPILPWWKMNANLSYFNSEVTGPNFSNDNFSWMAKLNSTMTVWDNIMVQLMLNYNSPMVMSQSITKEVFTADLALRKEFWEGKLSLLLRVSDLFNTQKYDVETTGNGFVINSYRKRDSQNIFFGITYRLDATQKMRERNTRTEADMENY